MRLHRDNLPEWYEAGAAATELGKLIRRSSGNRFYPILLEQVKNTIQEIESRQNNFTGPVQVTYEVMVCHSVDDYAGTFMIDVNHHEDGYYAYNFKLGCGTYKPSALEAINQLVRDHGGTVHSLKPREVSSKAMPDHEKTSTVIEILKCNCGCGGYFVVFHEGSPIRGAMDASSVEDGLKKALEVVIEVPS